LAGAGVLSVGVKITIGGSYIMQQEAGSVNAKRCAAGKGDNMNTEQGNAALSYENTYSDQCSP